MSRALTTVLAILGQIALAACIDVAPRSSVPFQTARDRHARYAAEVTLAIKEARRDELSEAAVNGRIVLPQMPEIWGIAPAPSPDRGAPRLSLAQLGPSPPKPFGQSLRRPPRGCAGPAGLCERARQQAGRAMPLILDSAVEPAAAPRFAAPAAGATPYRYEVYFGLDSSDLDAAARRVLAGALGSALMVRPARIIVAGHADRSGDATHNRRLSQRRAATVIDALIRAGIPPHLIETMALGEDAPALWTEDGIAHRHNRRVEITLV